MTIHAALLLTLLQAGMAADPSMAPTCSATPAPPPAGMEGWSKAQSIKGGANPAQATLLPIGSGVTATLLKTPKVDYAVRPEKPGGSVSSGGMFAFVVPAAGRYRIALGSGAWVDVLSGTTPAVSVSHGHGPDCTGIRKMVDFDLQPGRYLLQIAGNAGATLPLMVARLP
ncbi:homogentisate 1,2-dioxygenase [Sphingomonas sp.]|uniref:homogentisate 1,2-dioxygenase n=1 Tax=Sphingomonas sp. TaxID=28214 RepID=UPI000DB1CA5B|nr:homogentisate 1,2-dioxygenase [Sphingomonas sp.]PZU07285.1 MAG: homogentisate 1,2-dioxygenase [Sphingomonas sp.]